MERPLRLGDALTEWEADVVVVDCVTLLVSNLLMDAGEHAPPGTLEARVDAEIDELLAAWRGARGRHAAAAGGPSGPVQG